MNRISFYAQELLHFVGSRAFLYFALRFFGIAAVVLFVLFKLLGCYTSHGDSVTVPNLKGMTMRQVEQILAARSLHYEVTDSVFDLAAKPLQIMEQDPIAGSSVKTRRLIYLTLNAVRPPLVKIPDLIGKSLEIAQRNLEMRGLHVAGTEQRPDPANNTILEMRFNGKKIKAGDDIPKGTGLTLVVADGVGDTQLPVPELVCKTYDEARFLIRSNNLNLGAVVCDVSVRDTLKAYVWKQSPAVSPAEKIRMGAPVDVWLIQTKPTTCGGTGAVPTTNSNGVPAKKMQ